MSQTTIRINTETRDALEQLKVIPQEPFEQVVQRLIKTMKTGYDDEGTINERVRKDIQKRLQSGRWLTTEEMLKRISKKDMARQGKQRRSKPSRIYKNK